MRTSLCSFAALLIVLSCNSAAFSQTSYTQARTWIGVRGGITLGGEALDPAVPDYVTTGLKVGAIGGLQIDHWFGQMWAVSIQALYDQKGGHEDFTSTVLNSPGDGTFDRTLTYVEIPVLLKVGFGEDDFQPYVFAGPSFGLLLSAKNTTVLNGATSEDDSKDAFKSSDISIYFGAGFNYKISSGNEILFDAGYAAGLTSVMKDDAQKAKSSDIRLAIGMLLRI